MKENIKRTKLSEDVANRMIERIRSQEWLPGAKLPSEPDLAEHFGVSRATLRTAIKMLKLSGVLRSKNGSGTFVQQNATKILENKELAIVISKPENISELVLSRYTLEPQLCALAAENATEEEIERLFELLDIMENNKEKHALISYGSLFHQTIAEISHNRILYDFCISISSELRGLRLLEDLTLDKFIKGLEDHKNIAKAIKERDGEKARSLMISHLNNNYGKYLKK